MSDTPPPVAFLREGSYRRRRLGDALRLLPVVGAVLFLVPLLWSGGVGTGGVTTARALIYIFSTWAALIALCVALTLRLGRGATPGPDDDALDTEQAAEAGQGREGTTA